METETSEEAIVLTQPRNNGALDQHGSWRGAKKWLELEYILKTKMTGLLIDWRPWAQGGGRREENRGSSWLGASAVVGSSTKAERPERGASGGSVGLELCS